MEAEDKGRDLEAERVRGKKRREVKGERDENLLYVSFAERWHSVESRILRYPLCERNRSFLKCFRYATIIKLIITIKNHEVILLVETTFHTCT